MINAYARISGCLESNPDTQCDHRQLAKRQMLVLIDLYAAEQV